MPIVQFVNASLLQNTMKLILLGFFFMMKEH